MPASAKAKSAAKPDLIPVFAELKTLLAKHAAKLYVKTDSASLYYLETQTECWRGERCMFAAVRMGKQYVSYHLMPIYMSPVLQAEISPELKRRMQGKACFNFKALDRDLFRQLDRLTTRSLAGFRKLGFK